MSVHMIYYKDGAKMMRPVLTREEYLSLRNSEEQKAVLTSSGGRRYGKGMNWRLVTVKGYRLTVKERGADIRGGCQPLLLLE